MSLVRVTAPAPILTVATAKKHLRVEHDEDDLLIDGMVQGAIDTVDGPLGYLNRALGPQTWDWFPDNLPPHVLVHHPVGFHRTYWGHRRHLGLEIPLSPLIAVVEIEYRNTDGALTPYTTFDAYGVGGVGVGRLKPQFNTYWPQMKEAPDALRVRFTAGYGIANGDSPAGQTEAVPSAIKAAILLMVGDLYANRVTTIEGRFVPLPMSTTVEALLRPYRVWTLP